MRVLLRNSKAYHLTIGQLYLTSLTSPSYFKCHSHSDAQQDRYDSDNAYGHGEGNDEACRL